MDLRYGFNELITYECKKGNPSLKHVAFYDGIASKYIDSPFNIHSQPWFEIWLIVDGQYFYCNDKMYPVKKGDLVFVPPNLDCRTYSKTRHTYYSIICERLPFEVNEFCIVSSNDNFSALMHVFQTLVSEQFNKRDGYKENVKNLFSCILNLSARILNKKPSKNVLPPITNKVLLKAKLFLESKIESKTSLKELSDAIFFSPQYITKLFKKYLNTTPMHYLTMCKVQRGAYLLLVRDSSVRQISQEMGYDNVSTFISAFKQLVGESPANFRIKYRNDLAKGVKISTFIRQENTKLPPPEHNT